MGGDAPGAHPALFFRSYSDFIGHVGFGSVLGFCSGYALKKVGKGLALIVGLGFVVIQGAVYMNLISINWPIIDAFALDQFDVSLDCELDGDDLKVFSKRLLAALSYGLPSTSAFATGFILGFVKG